MSTAEPPIPDSPRAAPAGTRWRVVLLRLPPGDKSAIQAAFPQPRELSAADLPLIARVTPDPLQARQTAARLRAAGGVVVIMEEPDDPEASAFCPVHPAHLAERTCTLCTRAICMRCVQQAGDMALCAEHAALHQRRMRFQRLRQLFLLFLFAAFLYQVNRFIQEDRENVDPTGIVSVAVVQLVEPGQEGAPVLAALNDPSSPHALQRLGPFFDGEHSRYTDSAGGYLRLTVFPPRAAKVTAPTLGTPDDPWWRIAGRAWRYKEFFEDLAAESGADPDLYPVRVVVIYQAAKGDVAAHSRGSEKGRLAVSYIAADERNPAYALVTIGHELAHTLGAEDTYDPGTSFARHPEGFVEPFAKPLYPQRFAELMAVDVPLGPQTEGEVRDLDRVRIGYRSAAGMRWISEERAQLYYAPPEVMPEDRLPARQEATGEGGPAPPAPPAPPPGPGSG